MQRIIVNSFAALIFFVSIAAAQERGRQSGQGSHSTVPASRVIEGDYFAFGETVEISGTINGDLYASGGQVVIDGRVNGDVLVGSGRVSLSEPFLRMCGVRLATWRLREPSAEI